MSTVSIWSDGVVIQLLFAPWACLDSAARMCWDAFTFYPWFI